MPSLSLEIFLVLGVVLVNASTLRRTDNRELLVDPKTVQSKTTSVNYLPSGAEQYVLDNIGEGTSGCDIYTKEDSKVRPQLLEWIGELRRYYSEIHNRTEFAPDVRRLFDIDYRNKEDICHTFSDPGVSLQREQGEGSANTKNSRSLETKNNDLLTEYFAKSKELSFSNTQGFMEPLLPPFRHPAGLCLHQPHEKSMDYLVEDFGHVCRHKLTKESKTVFFDIGATYNFINDEVEHSSPVIQVIEKYRKFGIHFDDIYAYELQNWDVDRVYKTIPDHMRKPLHWINTGVSTEHGNMFNPWTVVRENYKPEDFVVVKLDIDTPSVELPLVQQLLDDPRLRELVDVFYFEHHVHMDEMKPYWKMDGTMVYSLTYFRAMRNVGIASHYWV